MFIKKCLNCSLEFSKKPNIYVKEWTTKTKYCSHSCANSVNSKGNQYCTGKTPWNKGISHLTNENHPMWKGGNVSKQCLECGSVFHVRRYRIHSAKFCSKLCKAANSNQGKTAEAERIRHSTEYKLWRKSVFERDGYRCVLCNTRGYMHADHIKPFCSHPDLRFNIDNGRTLCVKCHRETPTYGVKAWRKDLVALSNEA